MNNRAFLSSLLSTPSVTPQDASIVLLTRDSLLLAEATKKADLLSIVRGYNWNWINDVALFEVILRILALHSVDRSIVDGTCIGHLAKRLVQSEIQVGGPYRSDAQFTNLATNALIDQLFTQLGTRLPNVDTYVKNESIRHATLQIDKGEWALIWPYSLGIADTKRFEKNNDRNSMTPSVIKAVLSLDADSSRSTAINAPTRINSVTAAVRQTILQLDEMVQPTALRVWESVHGADKRSEISMLSHHFSSAIADSTATTDFTLDQLGGANYCTWMAYAIYDDFIDDEGQAEQLPVANIMHRQALHLYQQAAKNNKRSLSQITKSYDGVDAANAWELAHCRFKVVDDTVVVTTIPSYRTGRVLARRAHAHILGPLLLMDIYSFTAMQYRAVDQGLHHYLIARQINDDLHDWKQDLSHGHISFVVAYLLRHLRVSPGSYNLQQLIERMQHYFWKRGLQELCDMIIIHTTRAAHYYNKSELLNTDSSFVQVTIGSIEQSARQSIARHNDHVKFLETYRD